MAIRHMALRAFRVLLGVVIIGYLLHLARLATRDCTAGLYIFDNCLWVRIHEELGLPANKLLRAVALEVVGLALAGGIYAGLRLMIPALRRATPGHTEQGAGPSPESKPE